MRRSEIELPAYELKQGILRPDGTNKVDANVFEKALQTICAIANNGKGREGTLLIGVTDSDEDANRIKNVFGTTPRKVSKRYVVGARREADALGKSTESYFAQWKNAIRGSKLSQQLRDGVLAAIDYNDYYGLGVIAITVPTQREMSLLGDKVYKREGDETVEAVDARAIADIAMRFA